MAAITGTPQHEGGPDTASSPARPSLVSVILPVYNASQTVDRALASITGQTYSPIEIIVIDDCSSDDTVACVQRWMYKCDLRLIVQSKNGGPAAARNAGLAAARGDYIAFLDSDDEWLPEKTSKQVRVLESNLAASFCACDQFWTFPDGTTVMTGDSLIVANSGGEAWKRLLAASFIATPSVMVRRKYVSIVGGFDENLIVGEDQDYWICLARLGELVWVNEALVRIHKRAEGHMALNSNREIDCLLPMIKQRVKNYRADLSARECRAILGQRYAQIGRNMCSRGDWDVGAKLVLKAVTLGYSPVQNVVFLLRTLLTRLWLKSHMSMRKGLKQ